MIRRREFITLVGGAAAWPLAARAQQPAMPVIGWLSPGTREGGAQALNLVRMGLAERGYVENRNVVIEYRWADGQYERMPALAAELARLRVRVLIALTGTVAVPAALAASPTTPIVFISGVDPVQVGIVPRLNRPGGTITGVVTSASNMASKQIGLLHELMPKAVRFAVLTNPTNPGALDVWAKDAQTAAKFIRIESVVLNATNEQEVDAVFEQLAQSHADALLVAPDPFLNGIATGQIIALAARQGIPTMYPTTNSARAGGLMSYVSNYDDLIRIAGAYAARILQGEKPADLPVQQPTKFELVINLKTAKTLGLTISEAFLARADEVIE
jgi:putative ABC transport system substrate-binding protein